MVQKSGEIDRHNNYAKIGDLYVYHVVEDF